MTTARRPRHAPLRPFPLARECHPRLRACRDAPLRVFLLVQGPAVREDPFAPDGVLWRGATTADRSAGLVLIGAEDQARVDAALDTVLVRAHEAGFEVLDVFGERAEVAAEVAAEELLVGLGMLPEDWAGDGVWPAPEAQVVLRSLRAVADFPADAVPRPVVLLSRVEQGLDRDHLGDLVEDVVDALRRGEADPAVPGGRTALLDALPEGATLERILVPVLTDRGPRALPATRVAVPWLRDPAVVLDEAGAPLRWRVQPSLCTAWPERMDAARDGLDGDPHRVRACFEGSDEATYDYPFARVHESASAVTFAPVGRRRPGWEHGDYFDVAFTRWVDLVLERPLGGRLLLDPYGFVLPVLPHEEPARGGSGAPVRTRRAPVGGWPRRGGSSFGGG